MKKQRNFKFDFDSAKNYNDGMIGFHKSKK